jgi:hypothetical protein
VKNILPKKNFTFQNSPRENLHQIQKVSSKSACSTAKTVCTKNTTSKSATRFADYAACQGFFAQSQSRNVIGIETKVNPVRAIVHFYLSLSIKHEVQAHLCFCFFFKTAKKAFY